MPQQKPNGKRKRRTAPPKKGQREEESPRRRPPAGSDSLREIEIPRVGVGAGGSVVSPRVLEQVNIKLAVLVVCVCARGWGVDLPGCLSA